MKCINPSVVQSGDLIAFAEGEASKVVKKHIAACTFCQQEAAQLHHLDQAMIGHFYRSNCLPTETLAQYAFNLLTGSDQLLAAAHVRKCSLCQQEIVGMRTEEKSLHAMVRRVLKKISDIIEIDPSPLPRTQVGIVRGQNKESVQYQTEGVHVLIDHQYNTLSPNQSRLIGSVLMPILTMPTDAWLFADNYEPISTLIDNRGTFVFTGIQSEEYDIALALEEYTILLRGVRGE